MTTPNQQQQQLWKVLNEQRTSGNWEAKQSSGNNLYKYKVVVPSIKTVAEMEADDKEDIQTVKANAAYTALCINNFHKLAEALEEARSELLAMGRIIRSFDEDNLHMDYWTNDGDYIPNKSFKKVTEALQAIS